MKAPGAGGALISRAAFLANPKLFFHLLRRARGQGRARRLRCMTTAPGVLEKVQ
ncbi:hypothetical protein C2845_PM03G12390 [Panicum miliaceum]|uniref:Uncharacterized protein n=1 Tax=Panicum miliaceum TaxID=4540 RepID=A0A3L6T6G6_PANMI|nr:hypothetical protein C2845_PM03G12390 [Panicum miliaceum]